MKSIGRRKIVFFILYGQAHLFKHLPSVVIGTTKILGIG